MEYDYSKLRGKIIEIFGNISNFCKSMQLSETTVYSKLHHKTEFTQSQVLNACKLLNIPLNKMHIYFFETKVKKNLTK